jgi:hypothetical protein
MSRLQRKLESRNNVFENDNQIREGDVVQFCLGWSNSDGAEIGWRRGRMPLVGWLSRADCLGLLCRCKESRKVTTGDYRPWPSKSPVKLRETIA